MATQTPIEIMLSKLSQLLGVIDGKLRNKVNKTEVYTTTEVDQLFQNLVGLAPAELDTIYELAAALKNNEGSIGTILTQLAKKIDADQVYDRTFSDEHFLFKQEKAADTILLNGKAPAYYAQQTELDNTNQELSSVITQLTAAFENGTNIINGV